MYINLIDKIKRSIENYTGVVDFEGVYIGTDSYRNFYTHYEFTNFLESFLGYTSGGILKPDTLFIIGAVNLNQTSKLKQMYEELEGDNKYVVHLKGSVKDEVVDKSYFLESDLNKILPVDLLYSKYPFDLEEITMLVKELKEK